MLRSVVCPRASISRRRSTVSRAVHRLRGPAVPHPFPRRTLYSHPRHSLAMSGTNSTDVDRPRSVSPLEDLAFDIGKGPYASYNDRDGVDGQTVSRGSSSSPSTLVSKKISSRPTTPSGGKRRACIVHLDGCRYTIGSLLSISQIIIDYNYCAYQKIIFDHSLDHICVAVDHELLMNWFLKNEI